MRTSHKLTHLFLLFTFLLGAMISVAAQEAYVSDQQPGWMVVYPYYTSNSANTREDTFLTITNVSTTRTVAVHMYFMDGKSCAQADMFICLTPNASQGFKASEMDPDNTGYILAMVIRETGNDAGCPDTTGTFLIGNAFVNTPSAGIQGSYGAEGFGSVGASCVLNGNTARLTFQAPSQLAVEVQSPLTIPNQRLVMVGLTGDLNGVVTGAGQTGAGQMINGNETPSGSFSAWIPDGCQSFASLTSGTPRVPGGAGRIIPAGQVGLIRFNATAAVGLLLVPSNSTGRAGIRTIHKLRTTPVTLDTVVFLPGC